MIENTKFKGLFSDGDQTLWDNKTGGIPSLKVIESIRNAQEQKTKISLVTGRPPHLCREQLQLLKLKDLCVFSGGSQIIDPITGNLEHSLAIPANVARIVVDISHRYKTEILDSDLEGTPIIKSRDSIDQSKHELCIWNASPEDTQRILDELELIDEITAHRAGNIQSSSLFDIHITKKGADKRTAVALAMQWMGLQPEDTVGIGDFNNDLPMFEAVGYAIAMGNAPEELKQNPLIKAIAPPVEDDGVTWVIENYILKS